MKEEEHFFKILIRGGFNYKIYQCEIPTAELPLKDKSQIPPFVISYIHKRILEKLNESLLESQIFIYSCNTFNKEKSIFTTLLL